MTGDGGSSGGGIGGGGGGWVGVVVMESRDEVDMKGGLPVRAVEGDDLRGRGLGGGVRTSKRSSWEGGGGRRLCLMCELMS